MAQVLKLYETLWNLSAAEAAGRNHCDLLDFWSRHTDEDCLLSRFLCNKSPVPGIQQRIHRQIIGRDVVWDCSCYKTGFELVISDLPEKKTIQFDSMLNLIQFGTVNELTFLLIK